MDISGWALLEWVVHGHEQVAERIIKQSPNKSIRALL
jgi:hypothetical protein